MSTFATQLKKEQKVHGRITAVIYFRPAKDHDGEGKAPVHKNWGSYCDHSS